MSDTTKTLGDSMAELADNIEAYNHWRRGADIPKPDPEALGVWLSAAVDVLRIQAAQAQATPTWSPDECARVIATLRYVQGIAERGEGRQMREDETLEAFVLGYVKRLEAAQAQDEPTPVLVRDLAEIIGSNVQTVCRALVAMGRPPRSTNMAVSGEEALAVAVLHLKASQQAELVDCRDLLMRAGMALEVVSGEWRESDPTLRVDLARATATHNAAPQPAQAQAEPVKVPHVDDDLIVVPRGLIGAACYALYKQRPAPALLEKLRRYTVGDLSEPQPAQPERIPLTDSQRDALVVNMMLHGKMDKRTACQILALVLDGVQPADFDAKGGAA